MRRPETILFLKVLLPGILTLLLICTFWDKQEMTRSLNRKLNEEHQKLVLKNEYATNYFDPLITDINFLAKTVSLLQNNDDTLHTSEVTDAFYTFMSLNPDYYQLRILNNDGFEVVKWVRNGSELHNVPTTLLQDKSGRDYVKNSLDLAQNEVYISKVVLNKENGVIEVPHKPVVRFIAPIFNKSGVNLGMAIANYNVAVFIDKQSNYQRMEHCQYSLVESHGYWLIAPEPYRPWGFMFGDTTARFQQYYPDAWEQMQRTPSGHIPLKTGYLVYEMFDLTDSLVSLVKAKALSFRVTDRRQVYSISFLPQHYVNEVMYSGRSVYLPFFVLIALAYAITAFLWARAKVQDDLQRTELEQKNAQLKAQREMLLQQNKELEQFTHIAAHDLQEPLRTISSYLIWIDKRYTALIDDKGKKGIAYVMAAVDRMETLIKSLRVLHKQNKHTQLEKVDTLELVNDIVSDLKQLMDDRKASIIIPKALPNLLADRTKMKLVFQNLLVNAIVHTEADVVPEISVEYAENEQEFIFMVIDNAKTIDPKFYDRIFLIFQRLQRTDEDDSGVGVGLTIISTLVNQHGGKIWVEKNPTKGNTFKFSIPKNTNT